MQKESAPVRTLHNLLDEDMRRFISGEGELTNILPKWILQATSVGLKSVLQDYVHLIQGHLDKMEAFFSKEGITFHSLSNRVIHSMIEESEDKLQTCGDAEIRDACLLAAIQQISHYKICIYGTAAAYALQLEMKEQAAFFHEAELNEKRIDKQLSDLAAQDINVRAEAPIVLTR